MAVEAVILIVEAVQDVPVAVSEGALDTWHNVVDWVAARCVIIRGWWRQINAFVFDEDAVHQIVNVLGLVRLRTIESAGVITGRALPRTVKVLAANIVSQAASQLIVAVA